MIAALHAMPIGLRRALGAAALVVGTGSGLRAQGTPLDTTVTNDRALLSAAIGMHFQGFQFANGSDVDASQLFLIPLSYQMILSKTMVLDAYTVRVDARAKSGPTTIRFNGQLDSWFRLRWQYTPSTVLAVGLSIPTGTSKQDATQSALAGVIANDLLGYREGNWGAGWSTTAGITTAWNTGKWRVSSGLSGRLATGFESKNDTSLKYQPGSELRLRLSAERSFGAANKVEGGLTLQTFSKDKYNSKNIFAAGPRIRLDAAVELPQVRLSVANLWRSKGDLTAEVINAIDGTYLRDTLVTVGWQNLAIASASTSWQLTPKIGFAPEASFKWRTGSNPTGRGVMAVVGAYFPLKYGDLEYFPGIKLSRGTMIPSLAGATSKAMTGAEFSLIVRHVTRGK